jgi:TP901 family phage tail tape measure protein
MTDAGRITAIIDGDISQLTSALNQARSHATTSVAGIESGFKQGFGSGLQGSIQGITSGMGPLGSAISGVTGGLGLAATASIAGVAALGALGAASINTAANWESLMAGVSKTTGVEGSGLDQLSADLQQIRTETGATAEGIASAVTTAGSIGIPTAELAGFTEVAMQMGSAFSMSAESASEAMGKIGNVVKPAEMSWTEFATKAGSTVNDLADSMATSEAEILTGMKHLGAVMGLLKPPADTIPAWTAMVATVQSLGLAGDQAGEAIQDALMYATKDAKGAISGLLGKSSEQLQLDLRTNAPEVMQEAAEAIAALPLEEQGEALASFGSTGSKAIALLMGDLDKSTGKFDKFGKALDTANEGWKNGASLAEAYGKSQDTFNASMDRLGASLDVAGQKLGTVFLPVLTDVVDALTGGVQAAMDFGAGVSNAYDSITSGEALGEIGQVLSGDLMGGMEGLLGFDAADYKTTLAETTEEGTEEGMEAGADNAQDGVSKTIEDAASEGLSTAFEDQMKAQKQWIAENGSRYEAGMTFDTDYGTWTSQASAVPEIITEENVRLGEQEYILRTIARNETLTYELRQKSNDELVRQSAQLRMTNDLLSDRSWSETLGLGKISAVSKWIDFDEIVDQEAAIKTRLEELGEKAGSALKDGILKSAERDMLQELVKDFEAAGGDVSNALIQAIKRQDWAGVGSLISTQIASGWGTFDTKSFAELIADPAAVQNAATDINKFFDGTIVPGIKNGMENAKAAFDSGQITQDQVYEDLIKPLEQYADYLPAWAERLNAMFGNQEISIDEYLGLLDEMTKKAEENTKKVKDQTVGYDNLKKTLGDCPECAMSEFGQWQESQDDLFQGSYIGKGGQEYIDWKTQQIAAVAETQAAMESMGGAVLGQRYEAPSKQIKIDADTSPAEAAKLKFETAIAEAKPQMSLQIETSAAMGEVNKLLTYIIQANPVMRVQVSVDAYAGEIQAAVDAAIRKALA